jgi:hypothetical protein
MRASHVIACLEVEVHHVLELLPTRCQEQDPRSVTMLTLGAIEEECPMGLGEDQSFDLRLVDVWTPRRHGRSVQSTTKSSSNSGSSTAHLAMFLVAFGLWSMTFSGYDVTTEIL